MTILKYYRSIIWRELPGIIWRELPGAFSLDLGQKNLVAAKHILLKDVFAFQGKL